VSVGSLANTTVTWRRPTYPADGSARTIVTLGTLLARVQPLAGREAQQYGRELELTPVMVYVEGQVPVQVEDETDPCPTGLACWCGTSEIPTCWAATRRSRARANADGQEEHVRHR